MTREWSDPDPERPIPLFRAVRDDLWAHVPVEEHEGSFSRRLFRNMAVIVTSSGFHLTWMYRFSHTMRSRWGWFGRPMALMVYWWGRHLYGCSIAPTARLHGGLILPHPQGIVIGPGVEVGPRAWIFQNVTLGGAPDRSGLPKVGSDARIYAGAVLTGPIVVGSHVVIGANTVIYQDIPSCSIVRAPKVEVSHFTDRLSDELPQGSRVQ